MALWLNTDIYPKISKDEICWELLKIIQRELHVVEKKWRKIVEGR